MTLDLFGASSFPEGFAYEAGVFTAAEEDALLGELKILLFQEFDFHGFLGKRRVVSFGWQI